MKQEDDDNDFDADSASPGVEDGGNTHDKPSGPLQKRRRVTRACDECRRKKIKCDGKQPCTHCTVYSYGMYPADPDLQRLLILLPRLYLRSTL